VLDQAPAVRPTAHREFGAGLDARRGLGPEHLEKINPAWSTAPSEAPAGAYEKRPALDEVVQMMGGWPT